MIAITDLFEENVVSIGGSEYCGFFVCPECGDTYGEIYGMALSETKKGNENVDDVLDHLVISFECGHDVVLQFLWHKGMTFVSIESDDSFMLEMIEEYKELDT
jgi:hypothetical protein